MNRPLFSILTLFPEALTPYIGSGILGIAQEKALMEVCTFDFRDFARDRNRTVDDRPFGGGPGMVLKPEPLCECIEWVEAYYGPHRKIALCPSGRPFDHALAMELSQTERSMLLCGRYEGFDRRLFDLHSIERVSMGDFVLAGGELPALSIVEAAARLIPGVLNDARSAEQDSFATPDGLDHPHYTRPRSYRGHAVPEVLFTGDHQRIAAWREEQARALTERERPDLIRDADRRREGNPRHTH